MYDDETPHGPEAAPADPARNDTPLNLAALCRVIQALEQDIARIPGLDRAASALALAVGEIKHHQRPSLLARAILKRRAIYTPPRN